MATFRPEPYGPFTNESSTYATAPDSARAIAAMQAAARAARMRPQGSGGLAGAISRAAQAGLDWFESGGHPNRLYRPNEPLYHGPDWRETQGLVPGWATRAYNAVFHDPYIHYGAENDFALRGVPQGPSWANVYAQMNQGLGPHNLDPVRLGILRGLLAGAAAGGINADRLAPNDPVAQMVALRGLNPQDIRLGG